ncbi:MAG: alpha/beta hydrolase domain-containing protein [Candidatus Sulfopaludibacter sp.]|nr:alpha/beta hydrolase domain-containing protein [Candidatus Sulfopaludibacter sp.]
MIRWYLCILALACSGSGAVRSVEITERTSILNGAYERVVGRVHFGMNPKLAANRIVRDLDLAQLNANGEAESAADFYILQPADPAKANGTVLFEVSNRGGKGMLSRFNFARGASDFGDEWVMRQGFTLVWLGWEWDIPASNATALHFTAPHYRSDAPREGLVRAEFTPEKSGVVMPLGDRAQDAIPIGKPVALYVRSGTDSVPRQLPASAYSLAPDGRSIQMPAGFEAGMIYEFVYQGAGPVVAGAGLAAVRDFIAYLKYGGEAEGWTGSRPAVKRAIGFGISQSGRWLREFLYDGFNAAEDGRKVFDGVWADVAGAGRGSFNFRYAQPSRDGWPYINVFYPTDLFPFTDTDETDPVTGISGGLLDRARAARVIPKIFFTNDSSEYWGRAAALIHITADGKRDALLSPDTRIYFIAGVQHFPRSLPFAKQGTRYTIDVVDHRPVQRALLADLEAWTKDGTPPPPSVYPHIAAGQLTGLAGLKFPAIEGVTTPRHPRVARRLDFGPEFASHGVILQEPPKVSGAFPVMVPQVDADGIDLGGVRLPEVSIPLATFTGWNLRAPERGAPSEIAEFYGSTFPFAKTKEARALVHDPRLSIAERYAGRDDYLKRVDDAASALIRQRFVLPEDRDFVVERALNLWDALAK